MISDSTYVLFKLHESFYGIDIACVHEIIELPQLQRSAEMPSCIAGFLNYHGEFIQILDLCACLDLPLKDHVLDDIVIIIKGDHFFFGFIVPDILNIISLSQVTPINIDHGEEPPLSEEQLFSHVVEYHEQMFFVLDPHHLIKKIEALLKSPITEHPLEFYMHVTDQPTFALRAQNLMEPVVYEENKNTLLPLTIVMLGQNYFGIDPETIKEFFCVENFTPIPQAPPYLLGCLSYKGSSLTLVDISPILKEEKIKITSFSQALMIDMNHLSIGMVVDKVIDVIYVHPLDLQPIPIEIEGTFFKGLIKSIVFYEKIVLSVLDMPKILELIMKYDDDSL